MTKSSRMILIFSCVLALVSAQQDNTYWGSYELTQVGGSGGNTVNLLKLPENAPSFFEFANFASPAPVSPAPAFEPTVHSQHETRVLQQEQQLRETQQQFREQHEQFGQQQLRAQKPAQQQFRQQQPQQIRSQQPSQQVNQQTLRVLQQARQQQSAVQQLQQQSARAQQLLPNNRIEFLPPNSAQAQQVRQQIASGQFNPQPINPPQQRVASQQRVAPQQRVTSQQRAAPQQRVPSQQRVVSQQRPAQAPQPSRRPQTLNNALEQLRVFAQDKPQQKVAPVQRPVQVPQRLPVAKSVAPAFSSDQKQPRFSNFQPANRGRSQARQSAPVQQTPRRPAPLPQTSRPSVQTTPQFQGRPIVESAPQEQIVEEELEFNDYDAGEHNLSRFQQFQLRKKQAAAAGGAGPVAQPEQLEPVQPRQNISLEKTTIEEPKQIAQESNQSRKKFAVRRKRPRNN